MNKKYIMISLLCSFASFVMASDKNNPCEKMSRCTGGMTRTEANYVAGAACLGTCCCATGNPCCMLTGGVSVLFSVYTAYGDPQSPVSYMQELQKVCIIVGPAVVGCLAGAAFSHNE